jgi:hypothetical protein
MDHSIIKIYKDTELVIRIVDNKILVDIFHKKELIGTSEYKEKLLIVYS